MKRAVLLVLAISVVALSGAYYFQYVEKLLPCELCYWQRKPHMIIIPLMLVALLWARARVALLALAALAAVINAQISLFHVGVEQHWWAGLPQCAAPLAMTLEEIRKQIFESTVVPCDKAVWHLFGLSMAAWAGLLSLVQAGIALWGTRK